MSLLDDALKKRQQELESPEVPSHLIGLQENKEVEKTQPKKLFLTLLALLVLFSGGLSFAILKYSTSQIRPKVISVKSPEKAYKVPSQKVETPGTSIETTQETEKTKTAPRIAQVASESKHPGQVTDKKENNTVKKTANNKQGHAVKPAMAKEKTSRSVAKISKHEVKHGKNVAGKSFKTFVKTADKFQDSDAFFVTAARYQRDGRLREAIDIYRKILKIRQGDRKARLNLAAAYLQTGQISAANNILEKLYVSYPNDPKVLINYAIVLTKLGKLRKALYCLSQAENKGGSRFEILLNKGIVYRKMGKVKEAIKTYEEAIFLRPHDPRLIYNLAIAYDAAGLYQPAISHYKSFLENPDHDVKKDDPVRERLQQLYAYLNYVKHGDHAGN